LAAASCSLPVFFMAPAKRKGEQSHTRPRLFPARAVIHRICA
jgi:hypothetical protein